MRKSFHLEKIVETGFQSAICYLVNLRNG